MNNKYCSIYDCQYQREGAVAALMIAHPEEKKVCIFDPGGLAGVDATLKQLAAQGFKPEDVTHICLTHIHLDHSAGAFHLTQCLPNASIVIHPAIKKHLLKPNDSFFQTVCNLYGEEFALKHYGQLPDIPEEKIITLDDQQSLAFTDDGMSIQALETPGHTWAHHSYLVSAAQVIYAGDAFGVCYPTLHQDNKLPIFPTTAPTQFNYEAAMKSYELLADCATQHDSSIVVTHYGQLSAPYASVVASLTETLDEFITLTNQAVSAGNDNQITKNNLKNAMLDHLIAKYTIDLPRSECEKLLSTDLFLNSEGLLYWKNKQLNS